MEDFVNTDVLLVILEYALGSEPSAASVRAVAAVCRRFRDAVVSRPAWRRGALLPRPHVRLAVFKVGSGKDATYRARFRCGGSPLDCTFFGSACVFALPCCLGYHCVAYDSIKDETTCGRRCCGILLGSFMSLMAPASIALSLCCCLCGSCCICPYCCCGSEWDKVRKEWWFIQCVLIREAAFCMGRGTGPTGHSIAKRFANADI